MSELSPVGKKIVDRLALLIVNPAVRQHFSSVTLSWLEQRKNREGGPLVTPLLREDREWASALYSPVSEEDDNQVLEADSEHGTPFRMDVPPESFPLEGKYALLTAFHDANANGADSILDLEPVTTRNIVKAVDCRDELHRRLTYDVLKNDACDLAQKDLALVLSYFASVCLDLREKQIAEVPGLEQWSAAVLDEIHRAAPQMKAPTDANIEVSSNEDNLLHARHSLDFRSVHWYGADFTFTENQARIIAILWKSWENGTPDIGQGRLLSEAGIESARLQDVFKERGSMHPAWGTMIIPSAATKGTARLQAPA